MARYPEEVKDIVANCSRRKLAGWGIVKKCIDDDIAAAPVLERFAQDHAQVLAHSARSSFAAAKQPASELVWRWPLPRKGPAPSGEIHPATTCRGQVSMLQFAVQAYAAGPRST